MGKFNTEYSFHPKKFIDRNTDSSKMPKSRKRLANHKSRRPINRSKKYLKTGCEKWRPPQYKSQKALQNTCFARLFSFYREGML